MLALAFSPLALASSSDIADLIVTAPAHSSGLFQLEEQAQQESLVTLRYTVKNKQGKTLARGEAPLILGPARVAGKPGITWTRSLANIPHPSPDRITDSARPSLFAYKEGRTVIEQGQEQWHHFIRMTHTELLFPKSKGGMRAPYQSHHVIQLPLEPQQSGDRWTFSQGLDAMAMDLGPGLGSVRLEIQRDR